MKMVKRTNYNNQKRKKKKVQIYYIINFELVILLLKCVLVNLVNERYYRRLYNCESEIHLVIQIKETDLPFINITSEYYGSSLSKVIINGKLEFSAVTSPIKIEEGQIPNNIIIGYNNITLIYNRQITSCVFMFKKLDNIIKADLSKFDASKVSSMNSMFNGCCNLEEVNFGNINTSSVKNMGFLFYNCTKLKYLNLSNFDAKYLASIDCMFDNCNSLVYLNLYNFKIKDSINKIDAFHKINPNVK